MEEEKRWKTMDRAKKRLASAFDGFKSQHKSEMELEEKITAEDLRLTEVSDVQ